MARTPGNTSVGFVYFDSSGNNSTGLSESFDYIGFSDTSSPYEGSNINSPQQFRPRDNYFRGKQQNKRFSRFQNNSNFAKNSNNSFNRNGLGYKKQDTRRSKQYEDSDISVYYHPSMLEDPWAQLEKEMDPDRLNNSQNSTTQTFDSLEIDSNNLSDGITDSQDNSQTSTGGTLD